MIPVRVASRWAIATEVGPSWTVASSAVTCTEENDPPSTWVTNGKPPMLTSGLVGVDSSDCELGGQRVLGDGVGHPVAGDQHRQHGQHADHGDHHGS